MRNEAMKGKHTYRYHVSIFTQALSLQLIDNSFFHFFLQALSYNDQCDCYELISDNEQNESNE